MNFFFMPHHSVNIGFILRFLLAELSLRLVSRWEIDQFADGSIPRSIDEYYGDTIDRITTEGNIRLAREILFWVVYSMRPLYVQELQHTISLSQNLGQFTIDENFLSTVIKICAGLVVVDQVNALRFIRKLDLGLAASDTEDVV
jgi:hypothetical protein